LFEDVPLISFFLLVCRYEADYEEAKRKTKEALHPLKVELADVEDQVRCSLIVERCVIMSGLFVLDHRADRQDFVQEGGSGAQRREDIAGAQAHRHGMRPHPEDQDK
jgi:hypothetical protein